MAKKVSKRKSGRRPAQGKSSKLKAGPKKSSKSQKSSGVSPSLKAFPMKGKRKRLKPATGEPVIYGIQVGRKLTPIDMKPQPFRSQDLIDLNQMLKTSGTVQGTIPRLAFYEVGTGEIEKTKSGKEKKRIIRGGPLKGKQALVEKTVLRFRVPNYGVKWRQLLYSGGTFERAAQSYRQVRNKYESIKADALAKIGFTSFKEARPRLAGALEVKEVKLKGRTLTEAIRQIQVPVSQKWLKKNKVYVGQLGKAQGDNIAVVGNIVVTSKGKKETIPVNVRVKYLSDITNEIGRQLRTRLANQGMSYTSPRELTSIYEQAVARMEAREGGIRKKDVKNLQRLIVPGGPKAPRLGEALAGEKEFPLEHANKVFANLKFYFYKDALAEATRKIRTKKVSKKKKIVKKGKKK